MSYWKNLGHIAGCYDHMRRENVQVSTKDLQIMLIEFHRAMKVPILPTPQVPSDERVRLRASLIAEECLEFLEACFPDDYDYYRPLLAEMKDWIEKGKPRVDLSAAADALADIAYVVEGANLEFGIDSGPVLDEVHRANMAKVNGPIREDGKRLKPPNWQPPDIAGVLERQR